MKYLLTALLIVAAISCTAQTDGALAANQSFSFNSKIFQQNELAASPLSRPYGRRSQRDGKGYLHAALIMGAGGAAILLADYAFIKTKDNWLGITGGVISGASLPLYFIGMSMALNTYGTVPGKDYPAYAGVKKQLSVAATPRGLGLVLDF